MTRTLSHGRSALPQTEHI